MNLPRFQCNTCGEEQSPRMCGEWNCCKDHEWLTGKAVFAIERRYVSDYVPDGQDPEIVLKDARSLCCDGTVSLCGEDIYCRVCDERCWLADVQEIHPIGEA